MNIEIERKYLVDIVGELPAEKVIDIHQTYLKSSEKMSRRVRHCKHLNHSQFIQTTKQRISADRCFEQESEISEEQYNELLKEADPTRITIHKQRSIVHFNSQRLEIDHFLKPKLPHLLLEIETLDPSNPQTLTPNSKFKIQSSELNILEDVTGKAPYYNSNISKIGKELEKKLDITKNSPLLKYNTFGIDALARKFVRLHNHEDYLTLIKSGLLDETSYFILGGGSNVVFVGDYNGIVIHPENKGIRPVKEQGDEVLIEAQAGEVWEDFVNHCIDNQWYGLENLAAIPGTVGAAPVQNVGAYGAEAKDFIHSVHLIDIQDGSERWMDNADCGFGYRKSVFKEELKGRYLVDRVVFKLSKTFKPNLQYKALKDWYTTESNAEISATSPARKMRDTVTALRNSKLPNPKETGSAGSFFKNPIVCNSQYEALKKDYPDIVAFPTDDGHYKLAAGWLIEHSGWKGKSLGHCGVYEKQALVLVNRGGCDGSEVKKLSDAIIADIEAKFGVHLECEAIFV